MSRHHKKCCCIPCCPRPISAPRLSARTTRALVAGVLLFLAARNANNGPNTNTNVININSDREEDECYDSCCDSHC